MAILKCVEVSHQYGNLRALLDINWDVFNGEFWGIIGPNGSGKTTLLKILSGTLKPTLGHIFFNGKDLCKTEKFKLSQHVSVVAQNTDLNMPFTCREIVSMGRFPHINFLGLLKKKDKDIILESMSMTKTLNFSERFIGELSGGERQRVFIAQALCQTRNIIILDEPTSHLDINYQIEILDLLKRINWEEKTTIIVSLHDLNLASAYCDKLLLLKNGRLYAKGAPSDIISAQTIEDVYKVKAEVLVNPSTKNLQVIPISSYLSRKASSNK